MNKNYKWKIFSLLVLTILIFSFTQSTEAGYFANPVEFGEYIYDNYAQENFKEVYDNFADELKIILSSDEYIEFQQDNFEKYELEYTDIEVTNPEEISYQEFKKEFPFLEDEGTFYTVEVSYLIKFRRLGSRERESDKLIYLREKDDHFELFWDPEPILDDLSPESVAEDNG
ncbi:hypothetical protein [Halanaerobium hydrogeniformans]|uniref:hypothetical protein n=1 Tax=Halanaerobium hydrogeniformans TaxID=656519 RepID=UPI00030971DC|nr:hypothetical protein [Halanaerobium hydrogeniformans]